MKSGEAPEPLGIIVEMLRAGGYNTEERITTFVNAIVYTKCIPCDSQEMIKSNYPLETEVNFVPILAW